jgi:hypothetical protein
MKSTAKPQSRSTAGQTARPKPGQAAQKASNGTIKKSKKDAARASPGRPKGGAPSPLKVLHGSRATTRAAPAGSRAPLSKQDKQRHAKTAAKVVATVSGRRLPLPEGNGAARGRSEYDPHPLRGRYSGTRPEPHKEDLTDEERFLARQKELAQLAGRKLQGQDLLPPLTIGDLAKRLGHSKRRVKWLFEEKILPVGASDNKESYNGARFLLASQAYWVSIVLACRLSDVDVNAARVVADFAQMALPRVAQQMRWDRQFRPFEAQFDTRFDWFIDIGDKSFIRLATSAAPRSLGKYVHCFDWATLDDPTIPVLTAWPASILRIDLSRLAHQLKGGISRRRLLSLNGTR